MVDLKPRRLKTRFRAKIFREFSSKVDRLLLKTMPDESPKAQILGGNTAFLLATR
jgi:hypothetical protein